MNQKRKRKRKKRVLFSRVSECASGREGRRWGEDDDERVRVRSMGGYVSGLERLHSIPFHSIPFHIYVCITFMCVMIDCLFV